MKIVDVKCAVIGKSPIVVNDVPGFASSRLGVILGAMMRKLVHVTFGVIKSGQPFDPTLHGA